MRLDGVERHFFARPALEVAPSLLGLLVHHDGVTVRLTEVEAYAGADDPGSHAFRGWTPRTAVMFGPAGHLYIYLSYGVHRCVNVVTGLDGSASAVLLRAGEVVAGSERALARRSAGRARPPQPHELARGPGNLAQALGLGAEQNGADVCSVGAPVWFASAKESGSRAGGTDVDAAVCRASGPARVATGPRVGVSGPGGSGEAYPWRFWLNGESTVSAYRAAPRRLDRAVRHTPSRRKDPDR